jgi:hypothetical protein
MLDIQMLETSDQHDIVSPKKVSITCTSTFMELVLMTVVWLTEGSMDESEHDCPVVLRNQRPEMRYWFVNQCVSQFCCTS